MYSTPISPVTRMLLLFLFVGIAGTGFAQSTQAITNKLNVYEAKVNILEARVDQATAVYTSLMTQIANNGNPCAINYGFCQLQAAVNRFNGPLNVMKVKSNQLGFAGLSMGSGEASTTWYALQQAIDGNSAAASRNSATVSSMLSVGDNLTEMNRIIDGCIRREIQEIRQNL